MLFDYLIFYNELAYNKFGMMEIEHIDVPPQIEMYAIIEILEGRIERDKARLVEYKKVM